MRLKAISRWASRLFVPVALLAIAALLAVIASRPLPPASESAAGAASLESTTDTIDPESLPHTHTSAVDGAPADDHAHDAAAAPTNSAHAHSASTTGGVTIADGHTHDTTAPGTMPTGAIVSIDDPRLTPAQQNAARTLLVSSRASMAARPNTAALTADGYVSAGDNSGGLSHWVKDEFTHDGRELDPTRIESYMVQNSTGRVVGAMYILEPGKTMANVPNIAGELTTWHVHQPICFSTTQIWRFVSFASNRNCPAGSAVRDVPPMMHVWADDPACGPFVGTEGHGSTSCASHSH